MATSSGGSLLKWIVVLFIGLPMLVGACSTFFFCRAVNKVVRPEPKAAPEAAASCPQGSPCGAAAAALEAAGRADSSALAQALSDPSWLDRLPPAATATPREKGQYYLRALLGRPPATLEELRGAPLEWRVASTQTALDGKSAVVIVQFRDAAGQAEVDEARLSLVLAGSDWKIASPP